MRIQALIFDFDGVLVDSEPVRFEAGVRAFAERGLALDWETFYRAWVGRPDLVALQELLGDRAAEAPAVLARRNALYHLHLAEVPFFKDTLALLDRLPAGLPLAIATGSEREEVFGLLARDGLRSRFRAIVTAGDYARPKPEPDPFLAAAGALGLAPRECLALEDSPSGVAAARAAGMPVIAVSRYAGGRRPVSATWQVASMNAIAIGTDGEVVVSEGIDGD